MPSEAGTGRRGCFKYGCFGCLGTLGFLVIVAGVIAGMAVLLGPPEQDYVQPDLVREIPLPVPPDRATAGTDRGHGALPERLVPLTAPAGRVVLDLSGGEFDVVPGDPGEPMRVEGNYNAGGFELIENFEDLGADGWVWRVRFRRSVSWVRMLHSDQHEENRIRIIVPRGVPFFLEGNIRMGVSRLELGGLSVLAADLDLGMGDHRVSFSEPTPEAMERFELTAGMGEFNIEDLGNASPAAVVARGRMGEFSLDLGGAWRNDAEVTASWRMGECSVRLPDDVAVKSHGTAVFLGGSDLSALRRRPAPPPGAPTLSLRLSGSMGEFSVR